MFAFLLACAPPPLLASIETDPSSVTVSATLPIDSVELVDGTGAPVVRRQVVPASDDVVLRAPLGVGRYTVEVRAGEQALTRAFEVRDRGPATVRIQAPLGQDDVASGAVVDLADGAPVRIGVILDAHEPLVVDFAGEQRRLTAGERQVFTADLGPAGLRETLTIGEDQQLVELSANVVPLDELRLRLVAGSPVVPARADGTRDATVPAGRIPLPARWWDAVLDRFRLGFRPRDDLAARTSVGLPLANPTDRAVHVVVAMRVEVDDQPHPAFRPRTRDATDLTDVRRLVRVPAHSTVQVALPVYVDRASIDDTLAAEVVLDVRPLGASAVLHQRRTSLVVERGSPWASALFGAGLLSAMGGWLLVAVRFRSWVGGATRELTTVAVFGALSFVAGTASQVVGLGLASVLGPFAPFVMGLVDDAVRISLLATLLVLVPRSGVLALAILIGWLMRALALGAVHPVDAVYLGASILWLESGVAVAGLTRGAPMSVVRLFVGLALPNAVLTGLALAVSMVLYRLFYADLYVLALVLGPGLLYPAVGCWFAVPFAASLRRVAP